MEEVSEVCYVSPSKQGYRKLVTSYYTYASNGIFFNAYFSIVVVSDFAYATIGATWIAYFRIGFTTSFILDGSSIFKTGLANAVKWP